VLTGISIKKVCTTVRKIFGKYSNTKIHHLEVNGDEVTYIPDIANSVAQSFSQNSSSQQAENNRLSLKSKNMEIYTCNNSFSIDELTSAIPKSHDSDVGPDDKHYQMLKHLPDVALETPLHVLK